MAAPSGNSPVSQTPSSPQLMVRGRSVEMGDPRRMGPRLNIPDFLGRLPQIPVGSPSPPIGRTLSGYSQMAARGRAAPRPQSAAPRLGVLSPQQDLPRFMSQAPIGISEIEQKHFERHESGRGSRASAASPTESPRDSDSEVWSVVGRDRGRSSRSSLNSPSTGSKQGHARVSPLDLRWSQPTVSCCLSDKNTSIEALSRELANPKKGWKKGSTILAVRMPDGCLVSYDNRRLTASVLAVLINSEFTVPVEIHDWEESTGRAISSYLRPEHENEGEKRVAMTAEHLVLGLEVEEVIGEAERERLRQRAEEAHQMLRTISQIDPRFQTSVDRVANYGDMVLMRMYGKKCSAVKDEFPRYGFGYKMIPRIQRTVDPLVVNQLRHEAHINSRELDRRLQAASQLLLGSQQPKRAVASSPDIYIPSKSALRRLKQKKRRAKSGDVGNPEGRALAAVLPAGKQPDQRPVTAPATSESQEK
jgi:hypothetical protein